MQSIRSLYHTSKKNDRILAIVNVRVLKVTYCQSPNKNETISSDFINRNPRSMELLRIARKPQGFCLDTPNINYYYKLYFDSSNKYLSGWISHNTNKVLVSASTLEWSIRRHLYSAKDVCAAKNLGTILAQRCLQSGIYEVHSNLESMMESSQRVKFFVEAMVEGGIIFGEPPQIRERETYATLKKIPTFPWEISEEYVEDMEKKNLIMTNEKKQ